jgi:hypothetical protein
MNVQSNEQLHTQKNPVRHGAIRRVAARAASSQKLPARQVRQKRRGQALVVVTLAMVALIGIVGLAVDGGSIYLQRRTAQNAVDGAALAGTRTMLNAYEDTQWGNTGPELDGDAEQEDTILDDIRTYAAANGVLSNTIQAYFVNDNKQIVSAVAGETGLSSGPSCGTSAGLPPCQVGQNNSVPWSRGAKGIMVKGRAQTNSFFLGIFGYDKVAATANTHAFMGPASSLGSDGALLPVGFFTATQNLENLVPGQTYILIDGDSRYTSGNWGWVAFNGAGNANVTDAWIDCGYNPALENQAEWNRFCPRQSNVQGYGPTKYWTGWPQPTDGPFFRPDVQWGSGTNGWWLMGSTGTTNSNCEDLARVIRDLQHHNPPDFLVPIFDAWTGSGSGTQFHLANLAWFRIENSDVDCHINDPPPGGGSHQHWHIEGTYLQKYSGGSIGRHGNLQNSSLHVVWLEP